MDAFVDKKKPRNITVRQREDNRVDHYSKIVHVDVNATQIMRFANKIGSKKTFPSADCAGITQYDINLRKKLLFEKLEKDKQDYSQELLKKGLAFNHA